MIPNHLVNKVLDQAKKAASHSWEYSTVFEALLEYYNPSLSIFNDPFPDGNIPVLDEDDIAALKYVNSFISREGDQLCERNGT
jgi:hypothetical protein